MKINPDFKKVVIQSAKEAGEILRTYFRKPIKTSIKKDLSLVTEADFQAEKELYFAERGRGTFLDGKIIKAGERQDLSKSVILFDKGKSGEDFVKFCEILRKVGRRCRTFRFWGALSLELCYVASGRIDGLIDIGSKPWDFAAGVLITKEAGGKVTDFNGEDWQPETKNIIATNGKIHNQLLKLIK